MSAEPTPTEAAFSPSTFGEPDPVELAAFYRHLADAEYDGYCDLYANLARHLADDDEMLDLIARMAPATKVIPVLLFAAVHDRVLADPTLPLAALYAKAGDDPYAEDVWPAFRSFVVEQRDALADVVSRRTIQTNEVGRSAVLRVALNDVARHFDGRPLAMIEVGPSAGLNLFVDRFSCTYAHADGGDGWPRTLGDAAAGVRLTCELRGAEVPPLDEPPFTLAARAGVDIAPIDVRDDEQARWLEACVWPGIPDRAERLRAAIALARREPPRLLRGSVFELLPMLVGEVDDDVVPVLTSTWVLAYFSKEDRVRVGELLAAIGAERDIAAVTGEYPSVAPWVPRPERDALDNSGQAATVVGISTWRDGTPSIRPAAWMHAHGKWLDWLG